MQNKENSLSINQETMDVLVANVIPTTKYFESRFDHMQYQINEIKENQKKFEENVNKRFEQVDKRFEQVDKRFEQVDKRFEQVDKHIVDLTFEIQKLSKNMEVTIRDYVIERDRHYDNKFNNLRMFNIAMVVGIAGIIAKMVQII